MLTIKSMIIIMYILDINQQNCACGQCERSSLVNLLIVMVICGTLMGSIAAFAFGIICGRLILKKRTNVEQQSASLDPVYEQVPNAATQVGIELNDNVAYTCTK